MEITGHAIIAELYEITLTSGDFALFARTKEPVIFEGKTYQPIPIKRGKISYSADMKVDQVDLSFGVVGMKFGSREFSVMQCVKRGFFRNAHVVIRIVDMTVEPY